MSTTTSTNDEIILYSTGCPNCRYLESALKAKGITYKTVNSEEAIMNLGFSSAPVLQVGQKVMTFYQATRWVSDFRPSAD